MAIWSRLRWLTLLTALWSPGCVVSPVPQPPNLEPPSLDVTGALGEPCSFCDNEAITIEAPSGSIDHPEEPLETITVWVVNLDGVEAPTSVPVAADGSFLASVEGDIHDVFRLQARLGQSRSSPVDVTGREAGLPLLAAPHPLAPCFVVEPGLELDLGEVDSGAVIEVLLRNDCPEALTITEAALRVPSPALSLIGAPGSLLPGEGAAIELEVTAPEGDSFEAILLIEVSEPVSGEVDRRAVTLLSEGPTG